MNKWAEKPFDNEFTDLISMVSGDVLTDMASRRLYATDASIYQDIPAAVVRPKDLDDCVSVVKFARQHSIPIIPRAAGTSLAGQCVGSGMVVDCSRYMTGIIEIDCEAGLATVQPGVILDDLNDCLSIYGLMFAPDTSTSNRCMIGGMMGNNAAGAYSVLFGTTRDHIVEVEAVLSDGSVAHFGPLDSERQGGAKPGLEGKVYNALYAIVEEHRDKILECYPKPGIVRRNTAYPLDYLANCRTWNVDGPAFNIASFLCGTEGTLAFITKVVLQLVPVFTNRLLVCTHFASLSEAMQANVAILEHQPAAVELIDKRTLDLSQQNLEQKRNRFWIDRDPAAVLVVEMIGDDEALLGQQVQCLITDMQRRSLGYSYPVVGGKDIFRVWAVRKAGLGMLMGIAGKKKPVTVIEDAAVLPTDLPAFVKDVRKLMRRYQVECVYYGHASVGLLHFRPELDLTREDDRQTFNGIAEDMASLVKKYRGALSGEHGDGRIRGPFLRGMLGEEVYELNRRVKQVFDPDNLFNPGKILTYRPIDDGLRPTRSARVGVSSVFDWDRDQGLLAATEKCNGAGACRKSASRGTMCPSYHATKEELFSTRGRANLIRQALLAEDPMGELANPGLQQSLELCLGCKGCKSECPSNVDVARLKAEMLHLGYGRSGVPWAVKAMKMYPAFLRLASTVPRFANILTNLELMRHVLGVQGSLPAIAGKSLSAWYVGSGRGENHGKGKKVLLLCDIYSQFIEPETGIAAFQVMEAMGFDVVPVFLPSSPRLLVSLGLLDEARESLRLLVGELEAHMGEGIDACVGLEPSELLTLRDEAPDIIGSDMRELAIRVAGRSELFEEFMIRSLKAQPSLSEIFSEDCEPLAVHVHCHEKSMVGNGLAVEMFELLLNKQVKVLNTGCCGMAGHFGYKHRELSQQVAEADLLPALNALADGEGIVATSLSCRTQIRELSGRRVFHCAQLLADRLIVKENE